MTLDATKASALAIVVLAACRGPATPGPTTHLGGGAAQVDAGPLVTPADDRVDAAAEADADGPAPLVPLATSLDGVWELAESCHGAPITYTLTIHGPRGELVTSAPDGTRSQSVELRPAPSEYAKEEGALVTVSGEPASPLFRLVRSDPHVLTRYTLGRHTESVSLGQSTTEGSFQARCSTFISFIERDEIERQAWTRIAWSGLSIAYPSKVLRPPVRKPKALDFMVPGVWATSMAGHAESFSIRLAIVKESAPAALGKIIANAASWEIDEHGPMIAGHRGLDLQMGIEGVGRHHVAVGLRPGATLVTEIAWVSSFANEKLTMSSDMQLAIADRMLSSIEPGP